MFTHRHYRKLHKKKGGVSFDITVKETNLNIQAQSDLTCQAIAAVIECRREIEAYILSFPDFATALTPIPRPDHAPGIIMDMIHAAALANVGPMASVAGAVAGYTGECLLRSTQEVVVENGGDIFIKSETESVFSIYAGESPLSMTTGIRVAKRDTPFAVCTSSGTLGHSFSLGRADAATVLADSCPLADAMATSLGNLIKTPQDIERAIQKGKMVPGVQGIVIIKNDSIGLWGDLELVRLSGQQ